MTSVVERTDNDRFTEIVRDHLCALPALYTRCEEALQPAQNRGAIRERITTDRCTAMPFREVAADARSTILGVLASWAGLVSDERELSAPSRSVGQLAQFLARNADWLAGHPGAADFVTEIAELTSLATNALQDAHEPVLLGVCPVPDCQAQVHVAPNSTTVECAEGHELRPTQWLGMRTGQTERPTSRRTVPTKQAALVAGVNEATIRQWARRGKLTRLGSPGRAEYCLEELSALSAAAS